MKTDEEICNILDKFNIEYKIDDCIYINSSDIGKVCNYSNIRSSLKYIDTKKFKCSTNGGEQMKTFINIICFKELFASSRNSMMTKLGLELGLEKGCYKKVSIEESTISNISTVFRNDRMNTQFTVGKYKIDLYFPDYKIAVECDEEFHKRNKEKDRERQKFIEDKLQCQFIRYSPCTDDFCIFSVIADIRDAMLKKPLISIEALEMIRIKEQSSIIRKQEESDERYNKLQSELHELKKNGLIIDDNTTKPRKFTNGKKIQIYSEDGKTLIKTYETEIDARTDSLLNSPTPECIRRAIKDRTVYRKYRWASLDRHKEDSTFQDIGETVETKIVNIGYVAMINLAKTKIMNVFPDAKTASIDRNFKNGAAISKAIRQGSQSGGHYFKMWFDCDNSLKEDYLAICSLPEPAIATNACVVDKIHPVNGTVVQTYYSIASITKEMRCGRKVIFDAIEGGYIWKGYKWRKH